MDEFLRPVTHGIVTSVLLIIWSGLLLGLAWKALFTLWNFLQSRLLPRKRFQPVRVITPARPQFGASYHPALAVSSPPGLLVEVSPLLYLPPHNEMAEEILFCIPLEIEI